MRNLIALLALTFVVPSAYAQDGSEMSTNAEMRARFDYRQNPTGDEDAIGSNNDWAHRFKLGLTFRSGEKFTAHASFLHNASWGSTDLGIGGTGDSDMGIADGIGDAQNMILVNEAYASWMATDELVIRFGRGSFQMADGTVIATNDWQAIPTTFEGGQFSYDMEFARMSAFGVKIAQWPTDIGAGADDPEAIIYGLSADIKALPDIFKMANVHVISGKKDFSTNSGAAVSDLRYGVTVAGDTAGFDFRGTYAAHSGEAGATDTEGNMFDLEFGYSLPDVMGLRIHALYHMDSGTSAGASKNETYDPYFYERHANAGLMDILQWGNLTYIQAGVSVKPMDNLTVDLRYLMFTATEKDDSTEGGAGLTVDNDKDDLGSEIDLAATHVYDGGNFAITARAGMFMPGDRLTKAATEAGDTITQVFLEGRMSF